MIPAWPVAEIEENKRRLEILRTLSSARGYQRTAAVVRDTLCAIGVPSTHDQVVTSAVWLEEQGLITITNPTKRERVLRATQAGTEVAEGVKIQPGVMQPDP